jgi:hypothetical protein
LEETLLPPDHGGLLGQENHQEQPWDPIHLIHLYMGKGLRIEDWQREDIIIIIINLVAQVVRNRGHRYTPEDRLGVLFPTNLFKSMLEKFFNYPRPADVLPGRADLPLLDKSLIDNIREFNYPSVQGAVDHHPPLTVEMVADTIREAGWLLQSFLTLATTISATGLTFVDTLWYKPYESDFAAMDNHSIVAASRQKGILIWVTDCNTRSFNSSLSFW